MPGTSNLNRPPLPTSPISCVSRAWAPEGTRTSPDLLGPADPDACVEDSFANLRPESGEVCVFTSKQGEARGGELLTVFL